MRIDLTFETGFFSGLKGKGMRIPIIVGIIVVKLIVSPLIGVAIVKGAVRFGLIHRDPLYQFVLLLQFAVPPAVSISKLIMILVALYFNKLIILSRKLLILSVYGIEVIFYSRGTLIQ